MADETVQKLIADEKELTRQGVILDYVKKDITELKSQVANLIVKLDDKYVTHEEYDLFKQDISGNINGLMPKMATKEEIAPLIDAIKELKDGNKWIIRLVVGAIILAGMGLILVQRAQL